MKGFTGQYADSVTGLDYYNARYYDPVAEVFLSADTVQGNTVGMNPYGYVGGNPETDTDPTGKYYAPPGGPGGPTPPPPCNQSNNYCGTGNGGNSGSGGTKAPVKLGGCDGKCGNDDRQLITDYINKQRVHQQNVNTLVADIASAVGDAVSLVADLLGSAWISVGVDAGSLIIHIGAILADLQNLGIHNFSMSAKFESWIGLAKNVINAVDALKGVLDLFAPLSAGLKGFLHLLIPESLPEEIAAGLADAVVGLSSSGAGGANNYDDITYYNDALAAVGKYSDQQAHEVCLQDYGVQAQICQ